MGTNIAMDEIDQHYEHKLRERTCAERADGSKVGASKTERIRDELADGSEIGTHAKLKEFVMSTLTDQKVGTRKTERIRDELADRSKVGTRKFREV